MSDETPNVPSEMALEPLTDRQRRNWIRSKPWQWAGESYKIALARRTLAACGLGSSAEHAGGGRAAGRDAVSPRAAAGP